MKRSLIILLIIWTSAICNGQYFSISLSGGIGNGYKGQQHGEIEIGANYHFASGSYMGLSIDKGKRGALVRLEDIEKTETNTLGLILNILTLSNTFEDTKVVKVAVHKKYTKRMNTFKFILGYQINKSWGMEVGPFIATNKMITASSNEKLHSRGFFSDFEFHAYKTYGVFIGLNYFKDISNHFQLFAGSNLVYEIISDSYKVRKFEDLTTFMKFRVGIQFSFNSNAPLKNAHSRLKSNSF